MHCNAAETLAWLWFLHQEKISLFTKNLHVMVNIQVE